MKVQMFFRRWILLPTLLLGILAVIVGVALHRKKVPSGPKSIEASSPSSINQLSDKISLGLGLSLDVATTGRADSTKSELWDGILAKEAAYYSGFVAQAAGQDAFYSSSEQALLVVADGVGSWPDSTAVARLSRELVNNIATLSLSASGKDACSESAMRRVFEEAWKRIPKSLRDSASTTCAIARLCPLSDSLTLAVLNLGDSGVRVFRPKSDGGAKGGRIVFGTSEQQHFSNCPYQLGGVEEASNVPGDASYSTFSGLKEGDIIAAVTDGVLDNVYDAELAAVFSAYSDRESLSEVASRLLQVTISLSGAAAGGKDGSRDSPFASKYGLQAQFKGQGKPDDISIVLAKVIQRKSHHSE